MRGALSDAVAVCRARARSKGSSAAIPRQPAQVVNVVISGLRPSPGRLSPPDRRATRSRRSNIWLLSSGDYSLGWRHRNTGGGGCENADRRLAGPIVRRFADRLDERGWCPSVRKQRDRSRGRLENILTSSSYRGRIQLLPPLCLSRPDVAVVIDNHDAFYRAATCLTLDMAYNNARQRARPIGIDCSRRRLTWRWSRRRTRHQGAAAQRSSLRGKT